MNKSLLKKIFKEKELHVWILYLLSLLFLFCAANVNSLSGDTEHVARRAGRILENRMEQLDAFMSETLSGPESEWPVLNGLPEDMVVYKFVHDTLKAWNHQFTIKNDDLVQHVVFPRMANPKAEYLSPLLKVSEEVSLIGMGPKTYLAKSKTEGDVMVIGGLELINQYDEKSRNGVNNRLRLSDRFSINPLSYSGGIAVAVEGRPVFKVMCDSMAQDSIGNSLLGWIAFVLFTVASLLFLHGRKTSRRYHIVLGLMAVSLALLYSWGHQMRASSTIFSPVLYADGGLFYSLGAVFVINLAIILFVLCTYFMRDELFGMIKDNRRKMVACSIVVALAIVGVFAYTVFALKSITLNSGITLELYKLGELTAYSGLVYFAFIALLMVVPLLLQMLRPIVKELSGIDYNPFSRTGFIILAVVFSSLVVLVTAVSGFEKERNRQAVWANRLSIDRDIALEMNLRSAERRIMYDELIAGIVGLRNSATTILNRVTETYLTHATQDYEVSIMLVSESSAPEETISFLSRKIEEGTPIAEGSQFVYSNPSGSHTVYDGIFTYYNPYSGVVHMLIELEPKANKEEIGYARILGYAPPGKVALPSKYAYARYKGDELVTFRGNYAYSTVLDSRWSDFVYNSGLDHMHGESYVHFANKIGQDQAIIISRPKIETTSYLIAIVFLALVCFFSLLLLNLSRKKAPEAVYEKNYYRSRVSIVLVTSLIVTLVSMALVSVLFVYRRNDANQKVMMSDKLDSVRALVENACANCVSASDLMSKEFRDEVESASNMTKSDISLYTVDGKAFHSTEPEIFDRVIMGSRINEDAYRQIIFNNKRYFIDKERIGKIRFSSMYAPIYNMDGKMLAIMCSPYTEENFDFKMDAVLHLVTIFTVFLILLLLARFAIRTIVNRIFTPLVEMGEKMDTANIEKLEYIQYPYDDEITSLVKSYNSMVGELSQSTKQLAQAERDKAWSAMARQVAHEIKNPLTPMKLQLQRLIRLKERNAQGWEDKFDEVSKVVLDHIDILTDTANEFSTFAKLYSEEPTLIDLDALLKEEISMFDNNESLEFSYLGLEGAQAMAPKPQLTRVFVNLIANAVQAVEQQASEGEGGALEKGRILIQLRNSSDDAFYDIVFEDNGPGVSEENQSKLFTPNFTTKNGGTGLGLAICRSILEKCKATISYSKSYTLGGACFTIRYPKQCNTD